MALRKARKGGIRGLGWFLVVASFPVWLGIFAAPFLPVAPGQRVLAAALLAVSGELMFWVGGAILGASVLARFRKPRVRTGKSFSGKTIAVVGATGGLGGAIVEALARECAKVVALGRDARRLAALVEGRKAERFVQVDLVSPDSLEVAAEELGELDALVLASGVDVRKPLASQTAAEIESQLRVNLAGAVLATRAFSGRIREGGSIVILGGFGDGGLGLPYYSVDVATRAGVAAFAEAMNREFALEGRDLRVCFACPAPADTEAERPYAGLWRRMGRPPVPAGKVADFVLVVILRRSPRAIMGWKNALISRVNAFSPWLADLVGLGATGRLLRGAFGSARGEAAK